MGNHQAIPDLIENIFDAGLDPARWNDVVVGINNYVGGRACGLFSKDPISKFGVTHYFCGADPHYIQLYSDTYSKFDPLSALPRLGQIVSIPDLVDYRAYRTGRFYQEWLAPQGCVDAANVVLENSNAMFPILMTVLSGRGMVDREMRRRLAQIVPHLHRALRVNKAINAKQSSAATFSEALDGLSAGVFLVDARCHIVHANAAGRELLCTEDFLRTIGGRFTIRDARHDQALRKRFAAVADIPAHVDDAVLPLTAHDGERYVLHIMPLRSVTQIQPGSSSGAVAALFVRKAELDGQSCADLVARSFQLTRAESRVLFAIVEHGGVPETARTLGIAETTVKTHLHRVFAKTGATRQTDLIKLTAGYASPLASDALGRGH